MTENEKAATFIGGRPDEVCHSGSFTRPSRDADFRCDECGGISPEGILHKLEAPDMTRPENYMRALETIAERGLFVTISIYEASGGPHYTRVTIRRGQLPDEAEEPLPLGQGSAPEAGAAARKALAALYEKEHAND